MRRQVRRRGHLGHRDHYYGRRGHLDHRDPRGHGSAEQTAEACLRGLASPHHEGEAASPSARNRHRGTAGLGPPRRWSTGCCLGALAEAVGLRQSGRWRTGCSQRVGADRGAALQRPTTAGCPQVGAGAHPAWGPRPGRPDERCWLPQRGPQGEQTRQQRLPTDVPLAELPGLRAADAATPRACVPQGRLVLLQGWTWHGWTRQGWTPQVSACQMLGCQMLARSETGPTLPALPATWPVSVLACPAARRDPASLWRCSPAPRC